MVYIICRAAIRSEVGNPSLSNPHQTHATQTPVLQTLATCLPQSITGNGPGTNEDCSRDMTVRIRAFKDRRAQLARTGKTGPICPRALFLLA
jgi:hypothetical protein